MSHSSENNPPFSLPVRVLVVDDDTTCLSIVDAMLKKWNYEVVAVKHPLDALCILRMNSGSFDLVVLDVHMPEMNGFELQQLIIEEFDLPVVLMSADDKEGIILKGIEGGAVYFISKPIDPDDLRDLWQFAAIKKKNNSTSTGKENEKGKGKGTIIVVDDKGYRDGNESSVNEHRHRQVLGKRKYTTNGIDDMNNGEGNTVLCSTQRKQKVVWSGELHNRFLEAINNIGLERAVPKKILEEMNVPGLTRENVASHLQKYRIFLKRLADLSNMDGTREKSFSNRFFRSSLMSKNPALTLDKLRQHQMRTFYSRGYERYAPVLDSSNLGGISFPILETSSSNLMAQSSSRHGQSSSLLSNQDISMQKYQPPTQAMSKSLSSGFESNYGSSALVTRETSSNSNLMRFNNSNYVGFGMVNNDHTTELGQMGFINASNGFILNKGLVNIDGIDQNNKLNSTAPSDLWNGGEVNFDALFGLMNDTTSTFNMISPPGLPYECSSDINNAFTSQVPTQSSNQEQDRDEDADFWSSFDSFHIEDIHVPMDGQFSTHEQHQGAEPMVIASNPNRGVNAYFPGIDQNLVSQRDDEAFLESVFSPSSYNQANISFGGQFQSRRTSDQA